MHSRNEVDFQHSAILKIKKNGVMPKWTAKRTKWRRGLEKVASVNSYYFEGFCSY